MTEEFRAAALQRATTLFSVFKQHFVLCFSIFSFFSTDLLRGDF